MLKKSNWIPNICIPVLAFIFAKYNLLVSVISPTRNGESSPFYLEQFPSKSIILTEDGELPIIVPILYSGSDEGNNGHYRTLNIPSIKPALLDLERDLVFSQGNSTDLYDCHLKLLNSVFALMKNCGETLWTCDEAFPKLSLRPEVFKAAIAAVAMANGPVEVVQLSTNVNPALVEFKRRLGDSSSHEFLSIFPKPAVPIIEFDAKNSLLMVRDLCSSSIIKEHLVEGVSIKGSIGAASSSSSSEQLDAQQYSQGSSASEIITTSIKAFGGNSDPLDFLAAALSNTIAEKVLKVDKMARDIHITCDILVGT